MTTRPAADPYFMKSERLGFRCWAAEDLPLARLLWGDLEVTKFFGGPFSDEEVQTRFEREIERMRLYGFQYWPICLLKDAEFAGCCGLKPCRPEEEIHELGFHLRPKFWGQGLALEAARTAIAYGFETIGAKALIAGHHPENVNSKKVMTKLGFQYSHDEYFADLKVWIPRYILRRA